MIRAYDLRPDGTSEHARHYNFYPGRSADGMSIDSQETSTPRPEWASCAGRLRPGYEDAFTSSRLEARWLIHTDRRGLHHQQRLRRPDMKTLYVTAGKTLYKFRTDIAGLPR